MTCARCGSPVSFGKTHYCSQGSPFTLKESERHPYPEKADIIRVLGSCVGWIRRGLAEDAYNDCVGGNQAAERCIANAEAIIAHMEGRA